VAFEVAGKESNADGDEGDEEVQSAAEDIAPEVLYLQLDSKGGWELNTLPMEQVHRVKLVHALRVYLTEWWSEWAKFVKVPLSPKVTRAWGMWIKDNVDGGHQMPRVVH
jgi:choline dehydrogenase-like flavoprotein